MASEKRKKIRNLLVVSIGLGVMVSAASATPIVQVEFLALPNTSTESTGVSGRLTLSFSESDGVDYLTLTIANTTSPTIGGKLTGVGLEMPEELVDWPVFASGGTSAYFDQLNYNVGVSPGWMNAPGGYDLMISSDGKFEGGSPIGAPSAGEAQTIVLSLGNTLKTPDEWGNIFSGFYTQTTDYFAIARFQAVGPNGEDSDKVLGVHSPEPGALLFMTAGLAGFWMVLRRSSRGSANVRR